MASLSAAHARCLNCKKEVRPDDVNCRECGDRVKPRHPRARIELEPAAPPVTPTVAAGTPERPDRALSDLSSMSVGVQLTEEQQNAIHEIKTWYRNEAEYRDASRVFRLFGAAGTGKTTIAKHIGPALGIEPVYGAYTGKAAHVLRRKGVPATTIHSALYTPSHNRELRIRLDELRREWGRMELQRADPFAAGWASPLELSGAIDETQEQIEQIEREMRKPSFEFNPGSEWAYADLIVLDEVSMVNAKMAADIERLGVPVLVLGDPCQLPPIDGGGHYTDARPDVLLEQVHRQALESPVLALATRVRQSRYWRDRVREVAQPVSLREAMEADQVLVWKNSTRWSLIEKMRAKKGRDPGRPMGGDRIMCLVNNKDIGVFNGQQFRVIQAGMPDPGVWTIDALDEEDNRRTLLAYAEGFQGLAQEQGAKSTLRAFRGEVGLFTFADAITVHRAQGSEWEHVYVVDQTHQMTRSTDDEKRRWVYTAVTRARHKVTLASTEVR